MKLDILLILTLIAANMATAGCGASTSTTTNTAANTVNTGTAGHTMGHDMSNMDHSMMQSSPNAATAPYDLQFLDTMIHHHEGAVEMSSLAEQKAGHSEIKTLAKNIISSQEKEISQMKEWRERWFPGAAPALNMEMAGMGESMKGMDMKHLNQLSGNAYDLEFIKQMTPHHQGAVVMAKEALARSTKPEIKTLANGIIKAQEAEIAEMNKWQTAWAGAK
jgi:uncharacterized protein (DUF305 family)